MSEVVCVNFSRPIPLFPLAETVLLPHAIQPLHIFELRYRQMIAQSLDSSGQIAMAVLTGDASEQTAGQPELRPAVCVGQIVQHEHLDDGRHNILLHGVCRARICKLIEPDGDRLYRMAMLAPVEDLDEQESFMDEVRDVLYRMLRRDRLQQLRCVSTLIDWFHREDISTHALLELIGFAIVRDPSARYDLLAEADPRQRAALVCREIHSMDGLLWRVSRQSHKRWPKGVSWN